MSGTTAPPRPLSPSQKRRQEAFNDRLADLESNYATNLRLSADPPPLRKGSSATDVDVATGSAAKSEARSSVSPGLGMGLTPSPSGATEAGSSTRNRNTTASASALPRGDVSPVPISPSLNTRTSLPMQKPPLSPQPHAQTTPRKATESPMPTVSRLSASPCGSEEIDYDNESESDYEPEPCGVVRNIAPRRMWRGNDDDDDLRECAPERDDAAEVLRDDDDSFNSDDFFANGTDMDDDEDESAQEPDVPVRAPMRVDESRGRSMHFSRFADPVPEAIPHGENSDLSEPEPEVAAPRDDVAAKFASTEEDEPPVRENPRQEIESGEMRRQRRAMMMTGESQNTPDHHDVPVNAANERFVEWAATIDFFESASV